MVNSPGDSMEELGALQDVAAVAARRAGAILLERFDVTPRDVRTKTGPHDLVSAADLDAERELRAELASACPGDGVLGEEEGETASRSGRRWVIDPLDGTWNFLHGIPHWCVSVACERGSEGLVGVVYDPLRDECFGAVRGGGASLDGAPLQGPPSTAVEDITLGGEFSARTTTDADAAARLVLAVGQARSYGSAALDMAWLAAGRLHAVYNTRHPSHWDLAAGTVLCHEVGVTVRRVGDEAAPEPRLLAAPPPLLRRLLEVLGVK